MKIYLDNCSFNRPFDDQSQLRIKLESEAKLRIQDDIRSGTFHLVWSYILDLENDNNPYEERRNQIGEWKIHSKIDVQENIEIIQIANRLSSIGLRKLDTLQYCLCYFCSV